MDAPAIPSIVDPAVEFALEAERAGGAGPWGLCLTGESGSGKSALFARIYQELKTHENQGEILLLANAAGIGIGSGQVDRMLRRWIARLADFLGIENPLDQERDVSPAQAETPAVGTSQEIDEIFASLLGRAAVKTRAVLLLDALNHFECTVRARFLTWLPKPWPKNARLMATAIPGPETESLVRDDRSVELREVPSIERDEARRIA